MKITYVYSDAQEEWNAAEWRCAIPARAIQRTGRHTAYLLDIDSFANNSPQARALCSSSDVIVVQRHLVGPVLTAIQRWKARDKVVIADFHDALELVPPGTGLHRYWVEGRVGLAGGDRKAILEKVDPTPITQFKWGLRLVHAATVPSERLADDWRGYTDMYYLPDYLDLERYVNFTAEPHEGIVIGWGGSQTHLHSFVDSGLSAALQTICRARSQVKVRIYGDEQAYQALALPDRQKSFHPWVRQQEWPRHLGQFDIGLAPLYGPYDDRSSWSRLLEYMVMRIPWIASDSPAYQKLRSYGWLVQNTREAWERILLDMVDHITDYRAEAAGESYLYGLSQSIDENIETLLSTYAGIFNKAMNGLVVQNDLG